MVDISDTLILTARSENRVEVHLRKGDGEAEDLTGCTAAQIEFRTRADSDPVVTVLTGSIAVGTATGILTFTLTAEQAAALAGGVYLGFVALTFTAAVVRLREPFYVQVTEG